MTRLLTAGLLVLSTLAGAVLAGIAIGATAVGGLKAQGKGPVYVITDFSEITDAAAFAAGSKGVAASIAAGGGKRLVRTESPVALDGTVPKIFSISQFESVEKAKAWYASDAMKDAHASRSKNTKSRSFIVEGMPN